MMVKEEDFVQRSDSDSVKEIDRAVKNKFNWERLEEKTESGGFFSDCFRKLKEPGLVYCTICTDKINYSSSHND